MEEKEDGAAEKGLPYDPGRKAAQRDVDRRHP